MDRFLALLCTLLLATLPGLAFAKPAETQIGALAKEATPQGLTIHGTEIGVGKFHRYDNSVHPYSAGNAWAPYIMGANAPLDKTSSQANADGSYTIFFVTLEDFLSTATQIAKNKGKLISVLNVHGHGIPGAMWFPATQKDYNSVDCGSWRDAAGGDDKENYNQYYSLPSADEITNYHSLGESSSSGFSCTTGLDQWKQVIGEHAEIKQVLADDLQVHFLSCLVGLGSVGDAFTKGIADLLVRGSGRVEASTNFGLGDWSMEQGMGFWDYLNDTQLEHDRSIYPQTQRDADVKQKGTIRIAHSLNSSQLLGDQDAMSVVFERELHGMLVPEPRSKPNWRRLPTQLRVPGTSFYITRNPN